MRCRASGGGTRVSARTRARATRAASASGAGWLAEPNLARKFASPSSTTSKLTAVPCGAANGLGCSGTKQATASRQAAAARCRPRRQSQSVARPSPWAGARMTTCRRHCARALGDSWPYQAATTEHANERCRCKGGAPRRGSSPALGHILKPSLLSSQHRAANKPRTSASDS